MRINDDIIENELYDLYAMSIKICGLCCVHIDDPVIYNDLANLYYKRAIVLRKFEKYAADNAAKQHLKDIFRRNSKVVEEITDKENQIHEILENKKNTLAAKLRELNNNQRVLIYHNR